MRLFSLAFLLGILLLQNFSYLPDKKWVWIIFFIGILLSYWKYLRIPTACALGFAWVLWFAHSQSAWKLPDDFEGKTVKVTGNISSIPHSEQGITNFLFSIKKIQFEQTEQSAKGLLRLSWRAQKNQPLPPHLHVGDEWQLSVRLKKVHGSLNPGGFDYEAWALHEGIRANGYVVNKAENIFLNSYWYRDLLNRMREFLKEKIERNLPLTNTSPWIVALSLGERHGINQENWEVLRNTGTNHLMAIAGLHIGFMSGFIYAIVMWLWRLFPTFALRIPAQQASSIGALIMALTYSALAGFSIPTQRACIMLTVFLWVVLLRRKMVSWHGWAVAMLLVLLINPLSVLTESFWLSFGAVAFIIYGVSARLAPNGLWWKWGRIQWVIAVGLVPFGIWLFQQCSISSFIANSIAIPVVGFFIVPLCLLGSFVILFSEKMGGIILMLADKILSVLWEVLTWFAHLSWGSWYQVMPSYTALIISCIGVIILLLPAGFPGRLFGFIGFLPLIFSQVSTPKLGEVWLTLLDVGQGLSTIVQTKNHFLVFDAGMKTGPNFDMGESVVVPFLRFAGARKIDMLVVSHGDNDHIGGAPAIMKRFPTVSIKTSVPEKLPSDHTYYCLSGDTWQWDGVQFQFLYPTQENLGLNNDSSCVLRVSMGDKHILLTGDIEKYAEENLVQDQLSHLPANILIAPHHGSKTSGLQEFVDAVHPQYVLFPVGYRNRYRFPHAAIIEKYDALGTQKFDSANAGAITFVVNATEKISPPILYREVHKKYWNNF